MFQCPSAQEEVNLPWRPPNKHMEIWAKWEGNWNSILVTMQKITNESTNCNIENPQSSWNQKSNDCSIFLSQCKKKWTIENLEIPLKICDHRLVKEKAH